MTTTRSSKIADILIVGGGPAGLATALALRKRGASVTVVDARKPPIAKACGEGLMPDSLFDLAALGVNLNPEDGSEFRGIRFVNQSRPHGQADFATANFPTLPNATSTGLGVKRQTLHTRMVEAAVRAGVDLRWGVAVQLKGTSTHGEVSIAGKTLRPGFLVGADGQASSVRRWAALERCSQTSRRFGFRQHFEIAPWSEFVEVHWARSGQAYVTPVSATEICIAAVVRDPSCRVGCLLDELPDLKAQLGDGKTIGNELGSITTCRQFQRIATGNVALVGDASGSADAITGEGLGLSFRQAALLAQCIEANDLPTYNLLHPKTLELAQTMSRVLLWMDSSQMLRDRAIQMLASQPETFSRLLGVHMGAESWAKFFTTKGLEVIWRLVAGDRSSMHRTDLSTTVPRGQAPL